MGAVALYLLAWAYPTFPGDEWALLKFQSLRADWLDSVALAFANMGLVWVFVPAFLFLIGFLAFVRRYADGAMVFGGMAVIGIGYALKPLVDRPRPDHQLFDAVQSSFSFPSGHSLLGVMMVGILAYLAEGWVKPLALRRAIQLGLFLVAIAMGASRVYLGVHWPSDVIGSYVFGLLALVALIGLRNAAASAR